MYTTSAMVGKNAHLFANSTNSKQAARQLPSTRAKPVVTNIGLVAVSMVGTFDREYHCPNPIRNSKFLITDMEAWTEEGEKLLIEALGDDKACNFAIAVKEIVNNPDKYSASLSQNGQFCLLDFKELAKPSNNGFMGIYNDGFYMSSLPNPYQQDRNISRVLSYHSPGTVHNRSDVFPPSAAPSPAKQSKAHAKEFGEYYTWPSKAMTDPMMLEDDPTQEEIVDGEQFLALFQDRLKASTVTPRQTSKAERLAAKAAAKAERLAERRAERLAAKIAAKRAMRKEREEPTPLVYDDEDDEAELEVAAKKAKKAKKAKRNKRVINDDEDDEAASEGPQEETITGCDDACDNDQGFDDEAMMRLLDEEYQALQEKNEILEWQNRNPKPQVHSFVALTESPSNGWTSSPPWASLETPDSPAFSPPSVLARRKLISGKSKAKRLDFERVNLEAIPLQRPMAMPSIFEDEATRTPTKNLSVRTTQLRKGKKATRTTPLVAKVKRITPAKAPVTRAAARKVAHTTLASESDDNADEVVDLTNTSDGDDQDNAEEQMEMDM